MECTSRGVTGKSSGVSIRDGKSNLGNDPLLVKAFARLKLIGSNLEGSGTGPLVGIAKAAVVAPPPNKHHKIVD